jgi:hypothetical protein
MSKRNRQSRKTLQRRGLREIRLIVPDARSPAVRRRIAAQVARLNRTDERDVMTWIEAVSELDEQRAIKCHIDPKI